jgi:hypothetical protein
MAAAAPASVEEQQLVRLIVERDRSSCSKHNEMARLEL